MVVFLPQLQKDNGKWFVVLAFTDSWAIITCFGGTALGQTLFCGQGSQHEAGDGHRQTHLGLNWEFLLPCSPASYCAGQAQHHPPSSTHQGFDPPCEISAVHEQIWGFVIPKTKSAESAAPWEELGMVGGKSLFNEDLRQNSDPIFKNPSIK